MGDISVMDRLASPRFFPWAKERHEGRLRFPCEMWQQDHFAFGDLSSSQVSCEVDVLRPMQVTRFDPICLKLNPVAIERGVHALVTWTEVERPKTTADTTGTSWWSSAMLEPSGDSPDVYRFSPCAFKQGVLLAATPWEPPV